MISIWTVASKWSRIISFACGATLRAGCWIKFWTQLTEVICLCVCIQNMFLFNVTSRVANVTGRPIYQKHGGIIQKPETISCPAHVEFESILILRSLFSLLSLYCETVYTGHLWFKSKPPVLYKRPAYKNYAWFQASAAKQIRTAFFWVITRRVAVVPYGGLRITYWSHLQGSRLTLEDGTDRLSWNVGRWDR
jgi:hypothetical protein